jgi:SAM-dependent methyltransferase
MKKHESSIITFSNELSLNARTELFEIFKNYSSTDEEKERSLGLFLRGSLMARIFAIREVYEKIITLPGIVVDLGTWRGQTAVVCENLRAIFEPLHFNRRIIALDTFEGYKGFTETEHQTSVHKEGSYNVGGDYSELLAKILELHEQNNAMGHVYGKHKVIKGDCRATLPQFFKENPNEVVALSFFDLNVFDPTLKAFELIFEKLVPGGIIAFWQLNREGAVTKAEGTVYSGSILNKYNHLIKRSIFYPGLCYLIKT